MGNEESKSISGSKTKKKESLLSELKDKLHLHGQSCESKCETLNKQEQVAATDSPGAVDLSADPNNTANEGKLTELEQILEQKTFTRSEIDRLTSILHSRIVDISLEDKVKETAAASNSFGHPHKNSAFQMSVHEDCTELDDDSYPNAAASDCLAEERGKANSLLAETERRTTEAFTLEKPSNLTEINPSSSATQRTEIGTSVGSFTAENSNNLTYQSASSPSMTVLHASSSTSDMEQKYSAPIFNSEDKTGSTQDTNAASTMFGFSFVAFAASSAPTSSSPAQSTGFSFGASPASSSTPGSSPAPSTGFSFGASAAASGAVSSSPAPSTGFSFGACATSGVSTSSSLAPSTGFLFGASAASGATINSSSATGFAFGASSTSGATTSSSPAPSTFTFGSSSAAAVSTNGSPPVPFGVSNGASSSSIFSFNSFAATGSTQPVFGNRNTANVYGSSPGNNNQVSMEDSMAEDTIQASSPAVPVFGLQPIAPSPSPSGFAFGSTTPSVPNPFQFGGQANVANPQNPSPFQANPQNPSPFQANPQNPFQANLQNPFPASGSLGSIAEGSNFSMDIGGGSMDKSNKRYVKVKYKQRRK